MTVTKPKGKQKTIKIDNLVRKFKREALYADDEKFEKLFRQLEKDLEKLCRCGALNKPHQRTADKSVSVGHIEFNEELMIAFDEPEVFDEEKYCQCEINGQDEAINVPELTNSYCNQASSVEDLKQKSSSTLFIENENQTQNSELDLSHNISELDGLVKNDSTQNKHHSEISTAVEPIIGKSTSIINENGDYHSSGSIRKTECESSYEIENHDEQKRGFSDKEVNSAMVDGLKKRALNVIDENFEQMEKRLEPCGFSIPDTLVENKSNEAIGSGPMNDELRIALKKWRVLAEEKSCQCDKANQDKAMNANEITDNHCVQTNSVRNLTQKSTSNVSFENKYRSKNSKLNISNDVPELNDLFENKSRSKNSKLNISNDDPELNDLEKKYSSGNKVIKSIEEIDGDYTIKLNDVGMIHQSRSNNNIQKTEYERPYEIVEVQNKIISQNDFDNGTIVEELQRGAHDADDAKIEKVYQKLLKNWGISPCECVDETTQMESNEALGGSHNKITDNHTSKISEIGVSKSMGDIKKTESERVDNNQQKAANSEERIIGTIVNQSHTNALDAEEIFERLYQKLLRNRELLCKCVVSDKITQMESNEAVGGSCNSKVNIQKTESETVNDIGDLQKATVSEKEAESTMVDQSQRVALDADEEMFERLCKKLLSNWGLPCKCVVSDKMTQMESDEAVGLGRIETAVNCSSKSCEIGQCNSVSDIQERESERVYDVDDVQKRNILEKEMNAAMVEEAQRETIDADNEKFEKLYQKSLKKQRKLHCECVLSHKMTQIESNERLVGRHDEIAVDYTSKINDVCECYSMSDERETESEKVCDVDDVQKGNISEKEIDCTMVEEWQGEILDSDEEKLERLCKKLLKNRGILLCDCVISDKLTQTESNEVESVSSSSKIGVHHTSKVCNTGERNSIGNVQEIKSERVHEIDDVQKRTISEKEVDCMMVEKLQRKAVEADDEKCGSRYKQLLKTGLILHCECVMSDNLTQMQSNETVCGGYDEIRLNCASEISDVGERNSIRDIHKTESGRVYNEHNVQKRNISEKKVNDTTVMELQSETLEVDDATFKQLNQKLLENGGISTCECVNSDKLMKSNETDGVDRSEITANHTSKISAIGERHSKSDIQGTEFESACKIDEVHEEDTLDREVENEDNETCEKLFQQLEADLETLLFGPVVSDELTKMKSKEAVDGCHNKTPCKHIYKLNEIIASHCRSINQKIEPDRPYEIDKVEKEYTSEREVENNRGKSDEVIDNIISNQLKTVKNELKSAIVASACKCSRLVESAFCSIETAKYLIGIHEEPVDTHKSSSLQTEDEQCQCDSIGCISEIGKLQSACHHCAYESDSFMTSVHSTDDSFYSIDCTNEMNCMNTEIPKSSTSHEKCIGYQSDNSMNTKDPNLKINERNEDVARTESVVPVQSSINSFYSTRCSAELIEKPLQTGKCSSFLDKYRSCGDNEMGKDCKICKCMNKTEIAAEPVLSDEINEEITEIKESSSLLDKVREYQKSFTRHGEPESCQGDDNAPQLGKVNEEYECIEKPVIAGELSHSSTDPSHSTQHSNEINEGISKIQKSSSILAEDDPCQCHDSILQIQEEYKTHTSTDEINEKFRECQKCYTSYGEYKPRQGDDIVPQQRIENEEYEYIDETDIERQRGNSSTDLLHSVPHSNEVNERIPEIQKSSSLLLESCDNCVPKIENPSDAARHSDGIYEHIHKNQISSALHVVLDPLESDDDNLSQLGEENEINEKIPEIQKSSLMLPESCDNCVPKIEKDYKAHSSVNPSDAARHSDGIYEHIHKNRISSALHVVFDPLENNDNVSQLGKENETYEYIDKTGIVEEPVHSATDPFQSVRHSDEINKEIPKIQESLSFEEDTPYQDADSTPKPMKKDKPCMCQFYRYFDKIDEKISIKQESSTLFDEYKPCEGDDKVPQIGKEDEEHEDINKTEVFGVPIHSSTDPLNSPGQSDEINMGIHINLKSSTPHKKDESSQTDDDAPHMNKKEEEYEHKDQTEILGALGNSSTDHSQSARYSDEINRGVIEIQKSSSSHEKYELCQCEIKKRHKEYSQTNTFSSALQSKEVNEKIPRQRSKSRELDRAYQSNDNVPEIGKEREEGNDLDEHEINVRIRLNRISALYQSDGNVPRTGKEYLKFKDETEFLGVPVQSSTDQVHLIHSEELNRGVPEIQKSFSLNEQYEPCQGDDYASQLEKEDDESESMDKTGTVEEPVHSSTEINKSSPSHENYTQCKCGNSVPQIKKQYKEFDDMDKTKILGESFHSSAYLINLPSYYDDMVQRIPVKRKCFPEIKTDNEKYAIEDTKMMEANEVYVCIDPTDTRNKSVPEMKEPPSLVEEDELCKSDRSSRSDHSILNIKEENEEYECIDTNEAQNKSIPEIEKSSSFVAEDERKSDDNIVNNNEGNDDIENEDPTDTVNESIPEIEETTHKIVKHKKCKCHSEQIIQTQEDIQISYGVFCEGQVSKMETDNRNIRGVEIKSERSASHDNIQRLKVRIKMNDGRNFEEPLNPKRKEMNKKNLDEAEIEKDTGIQEKTSDSDGYKVNYETTPETMVGKPRVIRDGEKIRIFIPLTLDKKTADEIISENL